MMRRMALAVTVTGIVVALGCSIVPKKFEAHITIDIRQHIEEQASSALDFIEGKAPTPAPAPEPQAPAPKKTSWMDRAWDALTPMPVAYAAELKTSSQEVTRLLGEMRQRNGQVQDLKSSGAAGESNRGYLELRDEGKAPEAERHNEAQRLVAAENKDRKDLYQEIARINKEDHVSVSMVESVYAVERLKRAKSGEIFQLPPKGPDFDAFKASPAGQKLGAECAPGAWVHIK